MLNVATFLSVGLSDVYRCELKQPLPDSFLELLKRLEDVVPYDEKVVTHKGVPPEISRRSSERAGLFRPHTEV